MMSYANIMLKGCSSLLANRKVSCMEPFRCVTGCGVVQVMTNLHLAPFPRPVSSLVADYPLEQGHKGWQVRCHPNSSPTTFPGLPYATPSYPLLTRAPTHPDALCWTSLLQQCGTSPCLFPAIF
jgi:hypothetical protein